MPDRRKIKFESIDEAIADLERLRKGCVQQGAWTLPQIAFHIRFPIEQSLAKPAPAASAQPTAEQKQFQGFLEQVNASGWPDKVLDAPEPMRPPADATEKEIDALIASLRKVKDYKHPRIDAFIFGPVESEKLAKFLLAHASHHLSYLQPKAERRAVVRFKDEDEVIADVQRLRNGYAQAGSWSLPRMAWHLNQATQARMKPGPHAPDTPEQTARKPLMQQVLAMNGYLPNGIMAPDPMQPPANVPESTIDDLIASLKQLKAYKGEIAPHRLFGHIPDAEARKLNLIHCAHHLSYLVPTGS
jgi:hypothetical protein